MAGQVIHRPISVSNNLAVVVREVNQALREICQQVTENYFRGYPQIDVSILANTTQVIWIPLDSYIVEQIVIHVSSGTASVTPRINGVDMGVSGGVPITATTTITSYDVTSANMTEASDSVDCVVTGLAASAWITMAIKVRRAK